MSMWHLLHAPVNSDALDPIMKGPQAYLQWNSNLFLIFRLRRDLPAVACKASACMLAAIDLFDICILCGTLAACLVQARATTVLAYFRYHVTPFISSTSCSVVSTRARKPALAPWVPLRCIVVQRMAVHCSTAQLAASASLQWGRSWRTSGILALRFAVRAPTLVTGRLVTKIFRQASARACMQLGCLNRADGC